MFSTYLPRSEQEASSRGNTELKRKQNEMSTTISNQAKSVDKLSGLIGHGGVHLVLFALELSVASSAGVLL